MNLFKAIFLSTIMLPITCWGSQISIDLDLYSFSLQTLKSTKLKTPFNINTDLQVRFVKFHEDTYVMNEDEIFEYMQTPAYQRQRVFCLINSIPFLIDSLSKRKALMCPQKYT